MNARAADSAEAIGLSCLAQSQATGILVSPSSLTFTFHAGGSAPAPQTLAISSGSSGAITAVVDASGVVVTLSSNNAAVSLTVSVDPVTLDLTSSGVLELPVKPGFYVVPIQLSGDGFSPQCIPVFLNVLDESIAAGYPIEGVWQLTAGESMDEFTVQLPLFGATIQLNVSGIPSVVEVTAPFSDPGPVYPSYQEQMAVSGQFTFTFNPGSVAPAGNPCVTTADFDGIFIFGRYAGNSNGFTYAAQNMLSLDLAENGRQMNFGGEWAYVNFPEVTAPFYGTYSTVSATTGLPTTSGPSGCTDGQEYPQGNWVAHRLPTAAITSSAKALTFNYQIGASAPLSQNLSLTGSSSVFFSVTSAGGNWLSATPNQGTTPATLVVSVDPAGLNPGTNSGSITISAPGVMDSPLTIPVALTITADPVVINSVGNAASFTQSFAPGMLMSVFGNGFSSGSPQVIATAPLPLVSSSGTSVTINGVPAPLLYVSPTQINLQIPYEVSQGEAVLKVIASAGTTSTSFSIQTAAAAFFVDSLNGHILPNESAAAGSIITAFVTGVGAVSPAEPSGGVPPSGTTPVPILPLTLTVGGVSVTPVYAGIPDWSVGVLQLNLIVPRRLPPGPQPVIVSIGGISSPAALLTITPLGQ